MSKRKIKLELFNHYYEEPIQFPFCVKTLEGNYFRYQEDGRFEMVYNSENKGFTYGNCDYGDDYIWLKVLKTRKNFQVITEKEYIDYFIQIINTGYDCFLNNKLEEIEIINNYAENTKDVQLPQYKGEDPF